jgi:hypothetical protein
VGFLCLVLQCLVEVKVLLEVGVEQLQLFHQLQGVEAPWSVRLAMETEREGAMVAQQQALLGWLLRSHCKPLPPC